jgi:hypothetical protein
MGASGLQGRLDQFGDDLTSVVDLADASNCAVHWDLEEFLVVRWHGGSLAVTRSRASHSATALRTRSRRVCTTVFSMSDPEVGIIGLILDTLDGLDGIADVGKVDKPAVLFFEEIDEFDIAELAKVAFKLVLGESLKVFNVANIHVTRRARVHRQGESGLEWASVFAPTKLDSPIVQRQTLVRCRMEESERCCRVYERHELAHARLIQLPDVRVVYESTYGNMLVLHVPYALQHTTANRIAQILRCCLRMNISEVHGPVRSPGDTEALR